MKANDLMPGDLVTFKDCQNDDKPIVLKIWQINANGDALVSIDGDDALDEINIDDEVVGIPLTPEILENNGFESDTNIFGLCDYELSESYILENRGDRFCFVKRIPGYRSTFYIIDIKYVHELQHCLKLVGIDKEIEL